MAKEKKSTEITVDSCLALLEKSPLAKALQEVESTFSKPYGDSIKALQVSLAKAKGAEKGSLESAITSLETANQQANSKGLNTFKKAVVKLLAKNGIELEKQEKEGKTESTGTKLLKKEIPSFMAKAVEATAKGHLSKEDICNAIGLSNHLSFATLIKPDKLKEHGFNPVDKKGPKVSMKYQFTKA